MTGRLVRDLLSALGYALALAVAVEALRTGDYAFDTRFYTVAGMALRDGRQVYGSGGLETFYYAPPIAVACGPLSLLPEQTLFVLLVAAEVLALRYLVGDWRRVGYAFLFWPLLTDLSMGNINLLVAAAIAAACRSNAVAAPMLAGLCKLSPALAIEPRHWRRALAYGCFAVVVTVPWLALWPAWIAQLLTAAQVGSGPMIPVSPWLRLPVGLALVATRRPALRALGAVIATPGLYWYNLDLFLAPVSVWLAQSRDIALTTEDERLEVADASEGGGFARWRVTAHY